MCEIRARLLTAIAAMAVVACGNGFNGNGLKETEKPRLVKRERQAKFHPEDFRFVEYMMNEDGTRGQYATCLHVTLRDQWGRVHDCPLAITLPIRVAQEKWPRIVEEAAPVAARAANTSRMVLKPLKHADARTCRAFIAKYGSELRKPRRWPAGRVQDCTNFRGNRLPHFHLSRALLVGDYRAWSKTAR